MTEPHSSTDSPEPDRGRLVASVTCFADTDLVQTAYAVTGLIELANEGSIDMSFRLRDSAVIGPRGPFTLWLTVQFPHGDIALRTCCDFHDGVEYLCLDSLNACDVYFKANYSERTPLAAPAEQRAKIRPFGPYAPSRPRADRALSLRRLGNSWVHLRHRLFNPGRPTTLLQKLQQFVYQTTRVRRYLDRMVWTQYESPPDEAADRDGPLVFYNPACWPESNEDIAATNALRAEVIVALRELLGDRFQGGLRRNATSEARYPQSVENRPFDHRAYVDMVRRTPIALYTNGLVECFSWRLLESFAASRCIVSEPIVRQAPFALDEQAGVIQCTDVAQIVATIQRLQSRPEEVEEFRRRSWHTYVQHLRPATRMLRWLEECRAAAEQGVQAA